MAQVKPTGILNHSAHSAKRSEHYHAKVIGAPRPSNQSGLNTKQTKNTNNMETPRPGLTAQTGLGG